MRTFLFFFQIQRQGNPNVPFTTRYKFKLFGHVLKKFKRHPHSDLEAIGIMARSFRTMISYHFLQTNFGYRKNTLYFDFVMSIHQLSTQTSCQIRFPKIFSTISSGKIVYHMWYDFKIRGTTSIFTSFLF